jgi:hypothetical protein
LNRVPYILMVIGMSGNGGPMISPSPPANISFVVVLGTLFNLKQDY